MYRALEDIRNQICGSLGDKLVNNNFFGSDLHYYCPSLYEVEEFANKTQVSVSPYNPIQGTAGFDCDDFAFVFKGFLNLYNRDYAHKEHSWAGAIIWGRFNWLQELHVTNLFVTSDYGILLWEPQTNTHYSLNECFEAHLITF